MKISKFETLRSDVSSSKIWRYMSITKLISMIQTQSMYFTPIDRFEEFEGFYRNIFWNKKDRKFDIMQTYNSNAHKRNFALCWFLSKNESLAMWKLYSPFNDSIAIQSKPYILNRCLKDKRDWDIYTNKIKYTFWTSESRFNLFHKQPKDDDLFWYKDSSFEFENEWRMKISFSEEDYSNLDTNSKNGLNIKFDINQLIENIYISPYCSSWKFEFIKDLMKDFNISAEIRKSNI